MNITLTNKVAIVTGAASGIGLAVVRQYLASDIRGVVAVDVATNLPELLADAKDRVETVVGDVAREETAIHFTRRAVERFGTIDILVNNAGIGLIKPLHEHTSDDWDRILDTNLKAVFLACRHVLPIFIAKRTGVVLNTGSISGVAGIPGQGAYASSKGALHQMTRQMAVEYAPHNIRVNCIGCGTVDTAIVHRSAEMSGDPEAFWKMLRDNHPIGRVASAEEVAGFYVYLASDMASFFTGSILMLDGGYTAK